MSVTSISRGFASLPAWPHIAVRHKERKHKKHNTASSPTGTCFKLYDQTKPTEQRRGVIVVALPHHPGDRRLQGLARPLARGVGEQTGEALHLEQDEQGERAWGSLRGTQTKELAR